MFDHLHLLEINLSGETITDKNYLALGQTPLLREASPTENKEFYQDMYRTTPYNIEYSLTGQIKYLLELPMTAETKEHYIYLQSFSYTQTAGSVFTQREHYPSYLLVYTYQGSGEFIYRGEHYTLSAGDAFLIDCNEPQYYGTENLEGWTQSALHFYGGNSGHIYETLFRNLPPVFHLSNEQEFQSLLEDILRYQTTPSVQHDFKVSLAIQKMLDYLYANQSATTDNVEYPDFIRYIMHYMENNYQQELSLDELADMASMSKYHFCRQFKKYTSFSPKKYLINLRISHARMLLTSTDIPAYKIGILVGISNEANFIHLFKENVGLTPNEYRKQFGRMSRLKWSAHPSIIKTYALIYSVASFSSLLPDVRVVSV